MQKFIKTFSLVFVLFFGTFSFLIFLGRVMHYSVAFTVTLSPFLAILTVFFFIALGVAFIVALISIIVDRSY